MVAVSDFRIFVLLIHKINQFYGYEIQNYQNVIKLLVFNQSAKFQNKISIFHPQMTYVFP